MRTYKKNVIELDRPSEVIEIRFGNHRLVIEAVVDGDGVDEYYLEVRVPSAHKISSMVQHPLWPSESEVFFTNPEWFSSLDPAPENGGLQEIAGPVRFIIFSR